MLLSVNPVHPEPRKIRRAVRAKNGLVWDPPELIDQQRGGGHWQSIRQRFDDLERYSGGKSSRRDEYFAALVPLAQVVYFSDDFDTEVTVLMETSCAVVADDKENVVQALSPE